MNRDAVAEPPTPRRPRVSVVIPNWNGRELLERIVLPSLSKQTYRDFEVIVVDNDSTDSSCEYVAAAFPSAIVIRLSANLGFAAAVNRGIQESNSEFIALLNNDIELDERWLEELVDALESRELAGSVTGKTLSYTNRCMIDAAGVTGTWDGRFGGRGEGELDIGQYDRLEPIFGPTAGAAMYRRSAFARVGFFDEDFFAYVEDIDWDFRAQFAGVTCCYVPAARCYHVGQATSNRIPGLFTFLVIRNTLWLMVKAFPVSRIIRFGPKLIALLLIRSYGASRSGDAGPAIRAWMSAAAGLPQMIAKRRAIRPRYVVGPSEIEHLLVPRHRAGRGSAS
jgi:GT2 family glycosyltransferase